jgi:dihydrofolate reductase
VTGWSRRRCGFAGCCPIIPARLAICAGCSPYAHLRQYVVSRTLGPSQDPAVEVIESDPLGRIQKLKSEEGNGIWLCGGGNLAYQLLPAIDELVLKLYPIVIGSGIPLFAGEFRPNHFTLADRTVYDNGSRS